MYALFIHRLVLFQKPFPTKVKEEDTKPKIKLEDKPNINAKRAETREQGYLQRPKTSHQIS